MPVYDWHRCMFVLVKLVTICTLYTSNHAILQNLLCPFKKNKQLPHSLCVENTKKIAVKIDISETELIFKAGYSLLIFCNHFCISATLFEALLTYLRLCTDFGKLFRLILQIHLMSTSEQSFLHPKKPYSFYSAMCNFFLSLFFLTCPVTLFAFNRQKRENNVLKAFDINIC